MPNALMPTLGAAPVPGAAPTIPQPGAPPPNQLAPGGMAPVPTQQAMPQGGAAPAPAMSPQQHAALVAQQMNIQAAQAKEMGKKMDYMARTFMELARKPGEITREDVVSAGAKAIAHRMATPIDVADFLQKLPASSDKIKALLTQRAQAALHMAVHVKGIQMAAGGGDG